MKKIIPLLLLSVILTTVPVYAKGTVVKDNFKINSGYIYLDNNLVNGESITYKAVTYLPVRKISEAIGLSVKYDNNQNRIDLSTGGTKKTEVQNSNKYTKTKTDQLQLNTVDVYVNGKLVESDNIIYNGTTYLPLRKISEAVGLNVKFDSATNIITLNSTKSTTSVETSNNTTNNTTNNTSNNTTNIKTEVLKPTLTKNEINYPSEPKTVEDMEKVLLYMANYDLSELDIKYNGDYFDLFVRNKEIEDNMYTAFANVYSEYVELFSGVLKLSKTYEKVDDGNAVIITLHLTGAEVNGKDFTETQSIFEDEAYKINEKLKANGNIKNGMTQREIAKALYTYVDSTLTYDYATDNETNPNMASYQGYGAVTNKTAVCQGYTALYNYLLKLNGIKCVGQAGYLNNGVPHIWTVATLDGKKTYIDTTFGDTSLEIQGVIDYKYFDIDKSELSKDRVGVN